MTKFCTCRHCRAAKRTGGKVLWHRLLKHLGAEAHYVSGYMPHPKFGKGKRVRRERARLTGAMLAAASEGN